MTLRRRSAIALAALALALSPAAAFAQSAGDDQYEDPFGGEETEQASPTPTPAPATDDPGLPDEPAETAQEDGGTEEPDAAPAPTTAAPAADELPRTGADAGLVALFGAGFVLTGVGLRLRLGARSA